MEDLNKIDFMENVVCLALKNRSNDAIKNYVGSVSEIKWYDDLTVGEADDIYRRASSFCESRTYDDIMELIESNTLLEHL